MVRFEEYAAAVPREKAKSLPSLIHLYDTAKDEGDGWLMERALETISAAVVEHFGAPWELPSPIRSFDKTEVEEAAELWLPICS